MNFIRAGKCGLFLVAIAVTSFVMAACASQSSPGQSTRRASAVHEMTETMQGIIEVTELSVPANAQTKILLRDERGDLENRFRLTVQGLSFGPGDPWKPIWGRLGKELSYYKGKSAYYNGDEYVFTYRDFEVASAEIEGVETIVSITLLTSAIRTSEGLRLGAPEAEITERYEPALTHSPRLYTWRGRLADLRVSVEDQKVIAISYVLRGEIP